MLNRVRHPVKEAARLIRNLTIDLRYGGFLGGAITSRHPGATAVGSTDYGVMPQLFAGRITPTDVLVDFGCGKGRVINWWLDQGYKNKIIGMELVEDVAERTRQRLRRFPNVTIVTGDAIENLPPEGTLFYLANPISSAAILERFKDRLYDLSGHERRISVIYFAPVLLRVFKGDPHWYTEIFDVALPDAGFFEDRHRHFAVITSVPRVAARCAPPEV
jgi:Methyltransferase domain